MSVPLGAAPLREALGIYGSWGAFRERGAQPHCFAISEPVRRGGEGGRAFLTLGTWPARGIRAQVHVRLSRWKAQRTPVRLTVGQRRFALIAGGNRAWAADARTDAAIVEAIRAASSLSIEGTARSGRPFVDAYALRGAPSAIDAAALGCVGR